MGNKEQYRIKEIEARLSELHSLIHFIFPIWNMIDRKLKSMQIESNGLKEEKERLLNGQLMFTDMNF